ncbi:MAG: DNA repair protein RadC [Gammaproteobacteria bacterium]
MGIRDWPREERPREKLLGRGPDSLTDGELLAVLLGGGAPGMDAVEFARRLLARHGSLRALFHAEDAALAAVRGLGAARTARLKATAELARRYFAEKVRPGRTISGPADTSRYLIARLRDQPQEVFCCLFLDNRHRVIRFEEMFRGTVDGTSVYPREVVRRALALNAAAVILAHNHPSGVAEPSQADESITRRLKAALDLVDIRMLDHLIVGDGLATSLASRGLV